MTSSIALGALAFCVSFATGWFGAVRLHERLFGRGHTGAPLGALSPDPGPAVRRPVQRTARIRARPRTPYGPVDLDDR